MDEATRGGNVMDVLDLMILASMSMLIVFFAGVALVEWWNSRAAHGRSDERADAQVIQHPRNDKRISSAA
jgi:hypothetical protein